MLKLEEQIYNQIEKSKNILLVFPSNWEADNVSASLALFLFLKKEGKNVSISASKNNRALKSYSFLPGSNQIHENLDHVRKFIVSLDISQTKVSQIKYVVEKNQLNFIVSPENGWFESKDVSSRAGDFRYDLIISVGANDLESLGEIYDENIEFFYKTPLINLSCQAANEEFGQINHVDINSSTVCELTYNLIKKKKENLIDENIATNLLAGIILQTKNFKSGKLTPETLIAVSKLIRLGARREEIIKQLYRNRHIGDLKVWGKILQNLKVGENKIAWSKINEADFKSLNLSLESLQDLIDELMSGLDEAELVLIIIERELKTEMIAFSLKNRDALSFLRKYHPKGNSKIATAKENKSSDEVIKSLLA